MYQDLISNFKKNIGNRIIPLGVGLGLPYLYEKSNNLLILIPLLEKLKDRDHESIFLRKPVGEIRFELRSKSLIQFQLYSYNDPLNMIGWDEEFAVYPPAIVNIQNWNKKKYFDERNKLFSLLDDVYDCWSKAIIYSDKMRLYKLKFDELLEEGLGRYYSLIEL